MRFISRHPRYSFQAQAISMQVLSTPQGAIQVPATPQILCDFQQGGLSPWEIELGLKTFHFLGMPDQEAVPKENRLSVFDTETWQMATGADDETRQFVESRLRNDTMYGQDFIACEELERKPPWPSYDKIEDVGTIFEILGLLGYDTNADELEQIRLYEHQNRKRPEILQALSDREEALRSGPPAPEREEVFVA
jgi:hypothetical protein